MKSTDVDESEELKARTKAITEAFSVFLAVWSTWPVDHATVMVWVQLTLDLRVDEIHAAALRVASRADSWPTPAKLRGAIGEIREIKAHNDSTDRWRKQAIEDAIRLRKDPTHGDWAEKRLRELGVDPDLFKPPYRTTDAD